MKKIISILAVCGLCLSSLTACNTVKGAGRDISNTGKAIERSARN